MYHVGATRIEVGGRRWRSTSRKSPSPPSVRCDPHMRWGRTDARRHLRERALRPRLPRRVLAPRVGRIAAVVVVPKEAAPLAAAASVSRRSAARAARVRCRRRQTAAQQRRWRARWRGGRAAPPCEHSAAENSMQQRFEGRGYRRLARDARQAATQLDVLNEPHREAVASGLLRELWSGRHMTPTPATGFGRVGVLLYTLRSAATIQCLGVARQAA